MGNQENKQKKMLVRIQEKKNLHTLLVRMKISAATMEISTEVPQKTKNRATK
jgi:hypothetical protein